MGSNNEIKRKHFRFPAYSDETGVKINREGDYTPFSTQESWILTGDSTDTPFYPDRKRIRSWDRTCSPCPETSSRNPCAR